MTVPILAEGVERCKFQFSNSGAPLLRCQAEQCSFTAEPNKNRDLAKHIAAVHDFNPKSLYCNICNSEVNLSRGLREHQLQNQKHIQYSKLEQIQSALNANDVSQQGLSSSSSSSSSGGGGGFGAEDPNPRERLWSDEPEYTGQAVEESETLWDSFVSPFGAPEFLPADAERVKLGCEATGRQKPVTASYQRKYRQGFDKFSSLRWASVWSRQLSSRQSAGLEQRVVESLLDPDFDLSRIGATTHTRNRYLSHELGSPPIYVYTAENQTEVPFLWLLDALSLLLQVSGQSALLEYSPLLLHMPILQDTNSWSAWHVWFLSGCPEPSTFWMTNVRIFVDEYKVICHTLVIDRLKERKSELGHLYVLGRASCGRG